MNRRELYALTGSSVRLGDPETNAVHTFSVESAADSTSVMRPCDPEAKAFAAELAQGQVLTLTAGTPDGVLHGWLKVDRWMVSQRMLLADNPLLEFAQRRDSFRVGAVLPIEIAAVRGDEVRLVAGVTINLSHGGCAFTLKRETLVEGELHAAVIHIESRSIPLVLRIVGTVADVQGSYRGQLHQLMPLDHSLYSAELRRLEMSRPRTVGVRR